MNPVRTNIMLDLETLGTSGNAAIAAIGAVRFSFAGGVEEEGFYQPVDLQTCLDAGLQVDGDTLRWWMHQPSEVRRATFPKDGTVELAEACHRLRQCSPAGARIYSKGPDFDFAVLRTAFRAVGLPQLNYRNSRCVRTAEAILDEGYLDRLGYVADPSARKVVHHAEQDARDQASYLVLLWKAYHGLLESPVDAAAACAASTAAEGRA